MPQNHSFKTNGNDVSSGDNKLHSKHRHSANILRLYWLDGRRMLFNYAYFVVADLQTDNRLVLIFTSHSVILQGYNLAVLFELFGHDWQQRIKQQDKRYYNVSDKHRHFVHDIDIKTNG